MKILQVIEFFTPARGGSVNSVYNLSKGLAKNGHEVTIVTTDFELDKDYVQSLEKEHVKVIPFHCTFHIDLFLYTPEMKSWLKENIKHFDIVHLNNFRSYQNSIVCYYAKKNCIPYIIQPRGSTQKIHKFLRKSVLDNLIGYQVLKNAKKVILSSKNEYFLSKEILKKAGVRKENIVYIPNGIDVSSYQKLPSKNKFQKKYNIKNSERIILYLGRIHEVKGLDLLVESFYSLLSEKENLKLVIVGPDDGFLSKLKMQVESLKLENNVIFTGPLYEDDKLEAFVDADVFVLPSKVIESFGNASLEAIAYGTPTVVTNVCGVSEWIDNVVKVEPNIVSIKKGIEKALQKEKLGEKAKEEIIEKFSWNSIVEKKLVPLYKELMN